MKATLVQGRIVLGVLSALYTLRNIPEVGMEGCGLIPDEVA